MKPSLTFNYFRKYNSYQKGQIFLIFFLGGWGEGLEVLIIVHILYLCVTLTRSCTKYLSWLGMERDNITYLGKSKILMLVFSLVLFRRGPWNCACWQHPLSFMCSLVVLTYSKGCRIFFFFFFFKELYLQVLNASQLCIYPSCSIWYVLCVYFSCYVWYVPFIWKCCPNTELKSYSYTDWE